jgi:hypothetical protein
MNKLIKMSQVSVQLKNKVDNPLRPLPKEPAFLAEVKQEEVSLTR